MAKTDHYITTKKFDELIDMIIANRFRDFISNK